MSGENIFPALDPATEAALRASIERFGVLVPVVRDQHGRTLDGHHRSRIAGELGVDYRVDAIEVESDEHAKALAQTLNNDRRHMPAEQRRAIVQALAGERDPVDPDVRVHSQHAIADALGVSQDTVQRDENQLTDSGQLDVAPKTRGKDGKVRAAKRKALTEDFRAASLNLGRVTDRFTRLMRDDRLSGQLDQISESYLHGLIRAHGALGEIIEQLTGAA